MGVLSRVCGFGEWKVGVGSECCLGFDANSEDN